MNACQLTPVGYHRNNHDFFVELVARSVERTGVVGRRYVDLPIPFKTDSRRAKNPYQIGAFVVSEGGDLNAPSQRHHDPKSVESLFVNPF